MSQFQWLSFVIATHFQSNLKLLKIQKKSDKLIRTYLLLVNKRQNVLLDDSKERRELLDYLGAFARHLGT